jgi:hypothetical protein
MHASDAWFGSAGSISFIPPTPLPWHFVGENARVIASQPRLGQSVIIEPGESIPTIG